MKSQGIAHNFTRASAPARVCTVALSSEEALMITDRILTSKHLRFRRTGATGARIYTIGSLAGEILFQPADWFLGPLGRFAVYAPIVVHAVPQPAPYPVTRLTIGMPIVNRRAAIFVEPILESLLNVFYHQGVLVDVGTERSTMDLPEGPVQMKQFRRKKGD